MASPIEVEINGVRRQLDVDGSRTLLSVLRNDLELTGAKYGCGEAQCGACSVLVNGQVVRSCVTPVIAVSGRRVTTIEGLANGDQLHPVQSAFLEEQAFQCGFCTPGMILAVVDLLRQNPQPDDATIRQVLHPNICRCGTYPRIIAAVKRAARAMQSSSSTGKAAGA